MHTFLEKIRDTVKANKALSAGKLIVKLNPIIQGWARYHQHVVSKETFTTVDDTIHRLIRQWTKRRHPRKADEWTAKKYFTTIGEDNWVFYGTTEEHTHYLTDAAHVPIKRCWLKLAMIDSVTGNLISHIKISLRLSGQGK